MQNLVNYAALLYSIIHDCNSGSSSPMAMPEGFEPLLSCYPPCESDNYESDSMDELPEGRQEDHVRVRVVISLNFLI
jgi:hypothetical protein